MTQQAIDIGSAPNDQTGDPLRTAWDKTNDNFTELYAKGFYATGQYSDSGSQKPSDLNANPITINTSDDNHPDVTHAAPGEFTVITTGRKSFLFIPQWERTSGGATEEIDFWLQEDTGSGFVNIANSAVKAVTTGNGESGTITLIYGKIFNAGDKVRIVQKISSTGNGLGIVAVAASSPVPAIPSVILTIEGFAPY